VTNQGDRPHQLGTCIAEKVRSMALFDKLKGMLGKGDKPVDDADEPKDVAQVGFQKKKLDVGKRFEFETQAASGTMSKFRGVREIKTGRMMGLKFIDVEKLKFFEDRFKGLNKPSEGEIGMKLNHKRIVKTYEYGFTLQNEPYILMEYVPGSGLSALLYEESPLLKGFRLDLIRQMAEGIDAVHNAGFIHRDVCPRNFICNEDASWLKLIDFGLTVPDLPEFRQPGNRTGTPLYMAPEIVRRRNTDKRVDIFAFGVTCFRLITNEHPWSSGGDTSGNAALAHDSSEPKDIFELSPKLNRTLGEAIQQCIEPDPDRRPDTLEIFLRTIRRVTKLED
jgi:serine/threonine-protein kinase